MSTVDEAGDADHRDRGEERVDERAPARRIVVAIGSENRRVKTAIRLAKIEDREARRSGARRSRRSRRRCACAASLAPHGFRAHAIPLSSPAEPAVSADAMVLPGAPGYPEGMADIFDVLADGTRRELLHRLLESSHRGVAPDGEISVGELVTELGISQPTVSKHLKVLRDHGLVTVREEGQHRYYHLDPGPLDEVSDWLVAVPRRRSVDGDAALRVDRVRGLGGLRGRRQGGPRRGGDRPHRAGRVGGRAGEDPGRAEARRREAAVQAGQLTPGHAVTRTLVFVSLQSQESHGSHRADTHSGEAMARDLSDVRFLTVAEVAEMMRVSTMTVYRLVHSGELPAVRFGRSYRIPESAVVRPRRDSRTPTPKQAEVDSSRFPRFGSDPVVRCPNRMR